MRSMRAGAARRALWLAGQNDRDRSERQHDADHGEGVTEAEHQRLTLHDVADRHDRLAVRGGGVGDAVAEEVVGDLGDPGPHLVAAEMNGLADDVGVCLLYTSPSP